MNEQSSIFHFRSSISPRSSVFDAPLTPGLSWGLLFVPAALLDRIDACSCDPTKDRALLFESTNQGLLEHFPLPDNRKPDEAFIKLF